MDLQPRLIDVATPRAPEAAVLVLHGGASRGPNMMVSPTQLSVLRMIPIAKRIARAGRKRLAVYRLLNSKRGWDASHTPVRDAWWALDQIAERHGHTLPTCLVGHSLGGRAAIFAATRPEVRSAVALAPWIAPLDRPAGLEGKAFLFVHGTDDRVASPARAAALAQRLAAVTSVELVSVQGGKHAMLRHHDEFSRPAADFAVRTLLGP